MDLSTEAVAPGALLRQRNSRLVLETLAASSEPLRVTEITAVTGLSRPTVETVAEGLLEQEWLRIADAAGPAAGRPARHYEFNATAGYLGGVDVGAHSVTVCLADLRGEPVQTVRTAVEPDAAPRERFEALAKSVRLAAKRTGVGVRDALAWTVGTPGAVSPDTHRVVKSPGVPGWTGFDVASELGTLVDRPVSLENDANLAAVGERSRGAAQGHDDVLVLLLGQRLGAGVIANGQLVRGRHGAAGEVGYITAPGTEGRSPAYGSLESRVNASGLLADYLSLAQHHGDTAALPRSATDVTRAAEAGDATAGEAVRRVGHVLADGVAPALLTLDTDLLVVSGGLSSSTVLHDSLEERLGDLLLYPPEIRVSTIGADAVLMGALHLSRGVVETELLARVTA